MYSQNAESTNLFLKPALEKSAGLHMNSHLRALGRLGLGPNLVIFLRMRPGTCNLMHHSARGNSEFSQTWSRWSRHSPTRASVAGYQTNWAQSSA